MSSRSKSNQPQKRKRRVDWKYVAYVIFGLVMAALFVITAIAR
jgi:hypothetical protein